MSENKKNTNNGKEENITLERIHQLRIKQQREHDLEKFLLLPKHII